MHEVYHDNEQSTKVCKACGQEKPLSEMVQRKGTHGTLYRSLCKSCHNQRKRDETVERKVAKEARKPPPPSTTHRICRECGLEKPLAEMRPDNRYRGGASTFCFTCATILPTTKVCRDCGEEKPLYQFHRRNSASYRISCKACANKKWKEEHPPKRYHRHNGKTCPYCGTTRTNETFTLSNSRGKQFAECDTCHRLKKSERRKVNLKRVREQERASYHRTNKKHRMLTNRRARGIPPAYRVPETDTRSYGQRFRDKHPNDGTARKHLRRIAMYGTMKPTPDPIDYDAILIRDGWVCCICLKPIDPSIKRTMNAGLTFDHDIPLIRGGAHSAENIHPSHRVCNSRKHTKTLAELTHVQRRGL